MALLAAASAQERAQWFTTEGDAMHPAVDAIEDLHRKSFFDCAEKTARYKSLTAKVTAYQSGDGPEPTEAEFLQWCNDVKLAIRLKKLQSGPLGS